MITWIKISGFSFVIGNIIWPFIGQYGEPKFYYIPLSVFIALIIYTILNPIELTVKDRVYIECLLMLSFGNIIKQVFYVDDPAVYIKGYRMPLIKLVIDLAYGVCVIVYYLIYRLWVIRRQLSGKRLK